MCLENKIKRLYNFNLKLLFRLQMTKNDLTILLSYLAIFQMLWMLQIVIRTNNNNNNILNYALCSYVLKKCIKDARHHF